MENEDIDDSQGYPMLRLSSCTPAGTVGNGRPITVSPNFELCRSWLRTCRRHHSDCRKNKDATLPKRVIDVGLTNTEQPRLVETSNSIGTYITLSHRWGSVQPLATTKMNYTEHLEGLPAQTIPPLFQDAIVATRELGFRHLWIDSLCIIQDDVSDWESQCAVMDQIYENSAVTIAGSAAHNPDCHFLSDRRYPGLATNRMYIVCPEMSSD